MNPSQAARGGDRLVVPRLRNDDPAELLVTTLREIRTALDLPAEFDAEVAQEVHDRIADERAIVDDQSHIEFVTIDPEGSTDLDQAVQIERTGDGFTVRYAIADVPAFVAAGGALDAESRRRGQTLYAPDGRIPLYPAELSEGAASLLENQSRGAYVWCFELDAAARVVSTTLSRARIRSRHQYSYTQVQQQLDSGTGGSLPGLLRDVGLARIALERERGGASLNRPDEEIDLVDGHYRLVRRSPLPVEEFNAQISLMTGMAAADLMIRGRVGILRTMPAPDPNTLEEFRRKVAAIGCPWPESQPYGEYLAGLDRDDPRTLAALNSAATLFRGAGYTSFDGDVPAEVDQAAVGAPYAHTTAPLRRLVDRFVLVACESLANGREVPDWVRTALPELPGLMASSSRLASRLDHAAVDAIEAALLVDRVGELFEATVISGSELRGVIQLDDPVVTAKVETASPGAIRPGAKVRATLAHADIATGTVLFTV